MKNKQNTELFLLKNRTITLFYNICDTYVIHYLLIEYFIPTRKLRIP